MIRSIGNKLGQGHFGTVYEAEDSIRGPVAVKILRKRDDQSEDEWQELQETLLSEGQNLVKGGHQNVVQVHYVEPGEDGTLRLVMERCAGSLAQEYIDGPLTLARVRDVATSIAMGLDAIHARGMLHRDIKPANVLIDERGVAKLGDFGLVTDKIVYGYASVGDKKYAPHLAKEIWDGEGTSQRTDVWAFGMTVYRLMHGEEWYESYVPDFTRIAKGGYAQRLPWLPHVPKAWRRFVRSCLRDDSARRLQSASAVLSELAKLPIEPRWTCICNDAAVTWSTEHDKRRIVVEWFFPENEPQSWLATSLPAHDGKGKKRALGGSSSLRDLETFFEARAH